MNYNLSQNPNVAQLGYTYAIPPNPRNKASYDNSKSDIQISWQIISLIEENKMMYIKLTHKDEHGFKEYVTNGLLSGSNGINVRNMSIIGKPISVGCANFVSSYNLYNVNNECVGRYIRVDINSSNGNKMLVFSVDDIITKSREISDTLGKKQCYIL